MKKGFALLETIIVITFVSVSLLLLYGTFTSLVQNSKRNILYDDVSHIYQLYYFKEYLEMVGLNEMSTKEIQLLSCDDFSTSSCSTLTEEFGITQFYLVPMGNRGEQENDAMYSYLSTLPHDQDYDYWLVGEFLEEDTYHFASIGVMHDE